MQTASTLRRVEGAFPLALLPLIGAQAIVLLLLFFAPLPVLLILAGVLVAGFVITLPVPVLAGLFVLGGALFPFTGYRFRVALAGLGILLAILFLADRLRLALLGRLFAERTPLARPLFLFLGLVVLASILGIERGATIEEWPLEAFPYLCLAAVPVLARELTLRSTAQIYAAYAVALTAQSVYAVWLFVSEGFVRMHTPSFSVHPGLAAVVLLSVAVFHESRKWRTAAAFALIPMLLQLIATLTRGYWMGFLAGVVVIGVVAGSVLPRSRIRSLMAKAWMGLLVIVLFLVAVLARWGFLDSVEVIVQRFGTLGELGQDASTKVRMIEWGLAARRFLQQPLFGTGFGYELQFFHPLFRSRASHWWYVHNSYLLLLLKMGIVGLAAFSWMICAFFRYATRALRGSTGLQRALVVGFLANMVQFLVMAATNYTFCSPVNTPYLALILGGVVAVGTHPGEHLTREGG